MAQLWTRIAEQDGRRFIVPASAYDAGILAKVRRDVVMSTTLKFKRSEKRERWYWAFVQHVADGLGMGKKALHARIKYAADAIEAIIVGEHGPVALLESTNRESMDEARHAEFVNQAVEIVFRLYLPDVKRQDVLREVNRMSEVNYGSW